MGFRLSARSEKRLVGVHPDLVRVVRRAIEISTVDFTVLEGVRTEARQRELVASGASKTMKSRHLSGHAVDLGAYIAGRISWDAHPYIEIKTAIVRAAEEQGTPIEWGGDWKTFKDLVHFQLPWKEYPR